MEPKNVITLYVTRQQKKLFQQAADIYGLSLEDFIIWAAREAAIDVLVDKLTELLKLKED